MVLRSQGDELSFDEIFDRGAPERAELLASAEGLGGERGKRVRALLDALFPRFFGANDAMTAELAAEARRDQHIWVASAFDTYFDFKLAPDALGSGDMATYLEVVSSGDEEEIVALIRGLADSKRRDGSTRAEAFLDRLLDYAEDPEILRHPSELLRAVYREGDHLLRAEEHGGYRLGLGVEMTITRLTFAVLPLVAEHGREEVFAEPLWRGESVGMTVLQFYRVTKDDSSGALLLPEDAIHRLQESAVIAIRRAAQDGTLLLDPYLPFLVFRWKDWGDGEEAAGWFQAQVETNLVELLKRWRASGARLDPSDVAPLIALEDLGALASEALDRAALPESDRALLREFRMAVMSATENANSESAVAADAALERIQAYMSGKRGNIDPEDVRVISRGPDMATLLDVVTTPSSPPVKQRQVAEALVDLGLFEPALAIAEVINNRAEARSVAVAVVRKTAETGAEEGWAFIERLWGRLRAPQRRDVLDAIVDSGLTPPDWLTGTLLQGLEEIDWTPPSSWARSDGSSSPEP